MGLRDGFSFRQKPTGLFKRLLHLPTHLFGLRLGFLFGERFLMLTHVGRASGRTYRTVVEIVEHDRSTHEYIVCSGLGPGADWYRNIRANPPLEVQVRNRRWRPEVRFLQPEEAASTLRDYEVRHPKALKRLLGSMGRSYDGTEAGRLELVKEIPMVAFSEAVSGSSSAG